MENDPNKIPKNRAIAWFRVMLWIVPTGFAWMTGIALGTLSARASYSSIGVICFSMWVVANVGFVVGAGRYHAMLDSRAGNDADLRFGRVATFFFLQLLLIPFLSFLLAFAICTIHPLRI